MYRSRTFVIGRLTLLVSKRGMYLHWDYTQTLKGGYSIGKIEKDNVDRFAHNLHNIKVVMVGKLPLKMLAPKCYSLGEIIKTIIFDLGRSKLD